MKTESCFVSAGLLLVWAAGTAAAPPGIVPTASFQHQAAFVGTSANFTLVASGSVPLSCQWRLDGLDLAGQTNSTLRLMSAQPANEGDYTVVVTNAFGAVTSNPARLWIVPPATSWIKGNLTTSQGRLPYYYLLPTNYSAARRYPLVFAFHGTPGDESLLTTCPAPAWWAPVSYRQQQQDRAILVFPTRRTGDESWTDSYLRQASALLDYFISTFSVDTNRLYVIGGSEGLHAAWDLMGMRPGLFAGALLESGQQGASSAASLRDVPAWVFCAKDDQNVSPASPESAVRSLRLAGGDPIFTEYLTGGHADAIRMSFSTPVVVDWLLAQRRGTPSIADPVLTITNPNIEAALPTGTTKLSLSGSARALDQSVTRVEWHNWTINTTGTAVGTNYWSITDLPLAAGRTNLITVIGTTTSWAPYFGGSTTFSDTLRVACYPIRAVLTQQGTNGFLSWTGGGPPYRVQCTSDLSTGNWTGFLSNAVPPVSLTLTGPVGFYRVTGQ